jgi:hypothetical protein
VKLIYLVFGIIGTLCLGCESASVISTGSPETPTSGARKPKVHTDYGVTLKATIDAERATAQYRYTILNTSKETKRLRLSHDALADEMRVMEIAPQRSGQMSIETDAEIVSVSPTVRHMKLRPYLLSAENDEVAIRPLISKYDIDLQISVPERARILKSTVPFTRVEAGLLQWKMEGAAVVPPIDVWYTVALDQIATSSSVIDTEGRVSISLTISNDGANTLTGVTARMRFPTTLYYAVPEESDGVFELQQDIVYVWAANIGSLSSGQEETITIVLDKIDPAAPVTNLEVRVYNHANDLLAIEQTSEATPFFGG